MAASACSGSLTPLCRRRRTLAIAGDDTGEEVEQQLQREGDDHISLLPDSIIHHIFSFLPTSDAFKTRALSTRWRALCDTVPTLAFSLPPDAPPSSVAALCSFVDRVLDLRSSAHVAKFHLDLPCLLPNVESKLESWLSFAAACGVKDLRLELARSEQLCPALRTLRDCPSLVELRLCSGRMGFESSSGAINWASLRVLSMAYLQLTDDEITAVFEGSPMLESLELQCCGGAARIEVRSRRMRELVIDGWVYSSPEGSPLEVSAPHLQTLRLRGNFPRIELRLAEASSVAEAELNFSMNIDHSNRFDYYRWPRSLVRGILQKLCNATKLVVGCWYLQVLSCVEEGDLPPPLLPNCKSLTLDTRCRPWECHGILNMIGSSPQVEKLVIKVVQPFWKSLEFDKNIKAFAFGTQKYSGPLKWKNRLECLDRHLRRVDIVHFDPSHYWSSSLHDLVKFILKEALVLDMMFIDACKVKADGSNSAEIHDPRRLLEVSQSILRHQRASKNAEVVLYCD